MDNGEVTISVFYRKYTPFAFTVVIFSTANNPAQSIHHPAHSL